MNIIHTTGVTRANGNLTLDVPLGQPLTKFEIAIVAQPQSTGSPNDAGSLDWRTAADAIRERLRATGRTFGDSANLVREDRDR